jgi:uncharacterized protein
MATGEVVHIEFPCKDVDRGQAFWGGLFGWEFGTVMEGMDYRMGQAGGNAGAAVFPSEDTGHPAFYFDTPDIEASMATVRELGGETADKMAVPTHGWHAACKDSEGNAFSLWQADTNAA